MNHPLVQLAHDLSTADGPDPELDYRIFHLMSEYGDEPISLRPYTSSAQMAAHLLTEDLYVEIGQGGEFDCWANIINSICESFGKRRATTVALAICAAMCYYIANKNSIDLSISDVKTPTPRPDGSRQERY